MPDQRASARSRHRDSAATFRDAAQLLWRCAGYWSDMQARSEGWQIHYAVDIDVIASYLAPQSKKRYGVVLSDDDALAEILIRMMSEFVLHQLVGSGAAAGGKGSLLIISPHDEELDRMLLALRHKLVSDTERVPAQFESASQLIKHGATDDEVGDYLLQHANELTQAMQGRAGALDEIDRFTRLPPNRLLNSLRLQLRDGEGRPFALPPPPADAEDPAYGDYVERYGAWKTALERRQGGDKPEHSIRRDAQVLATLEWCNQRICAGKHRLVLITGSRNIFDAEQDLRPKALTRVGETFGAKYLRHIHACLGDEAFFATDNPDAARWSSPEFRVFDWLNLMFPTYIVKGGDTAAPRLDAIHRLLQSSDEHWQAIAKDLPLIAAYKAKEKDPSLFIDRLVQRWTDQVRSVAVERGVALAVEDPRSRAAQLVAKLREHVGSDRTELEFRGFLAERASRSLTRLYKATTYLGVLALRDGSSRIHGVPSLRFGPAFARAQSVCTDMQEAMFQDSARIDLGALYAELRKVDPDDYHPLVIHAFVYAIRGHWFGTLTLCLTALDVVQSIEPGARGSRDGREAKYLLAVAQRRLADQPADLDIALATLEDAAALDADARHPDPRFASERIAIGCARVYLASFGPQAAGVSGAAALRAVDAAVPAALLLLDSLRDEPLLPVAAWVTRQLYSNLFGMALLAEMAQPGSALRVVDVLQPLDAALRERQLSPEPVGRYADIESDVIFWTSTAVFAPQRAMRQQAGRWLEKLDITLFGSERTRIAALAELGRSRGGRS